MNVNNVSILNNIHYILTKEFINVNNASLLNISYVLLIGKNII